MIAEQIPLFDAGGDSDGVEKVVVNPAPEEITMGKGIGMTRCVQKLMDSKIKFNVFFLRSRRHVTNLKCSTFA